MRYLFVIAVTIACAACSDMGEDLVQATISVNVSRPHLLITNNITEAIHYTVIGAKVARSPSLLYLFSTDQNRILPNVTVRSDYTEWLNRGEDAAVVFWWRATSTSQGYPRINEINEVEVRLR